MELNALNLSGEPVSGPPFPRASSGGVGGRNPAQDHPDSAIDGPRVPGSIRTQSDAAARAVVPQREIKA